MAEIQARFQLHWPAFSLDVDLTLPHNGITAIFGSSGSGKTTLLRCIAGLERAPVGRLLVNGEIWQDAQHWKPTHQRSLGYVFQEASLLAHLSVIDNLHYGRRRLHGKAKISLDHAIDLLGISHLLVRRPEHLSGGEKSRVAIARALAVNPQILLMDEPLAALDLKRKQEILPYLERLHDALDIPILYVTHAPDEVAKLADHLLLMEQGRVVAAGSLSEMLARVDLPVRLGDDTGVIIAAHVAERDAQWHLTKLAFDGGSVWTQDQGLPIGHNVRVRVLARDVSLAREKPDHSSIQNVLQGVVDAIADDEHPALALVRVRVGNQPLLARLTKRAVHLLHLVPQQAVWIQVKSVALMD